jgi:VWFA-related protein
MKHAIAGSFVWAVALMVPQAYGQALQTRVGQTADSLAADDAITLDLVAHDKKSKPVLDLKPEDLAVTDDGSPVTLKSLRLVRGEKQGEPLITLVFDRPGAERGMEQHTVPAMMKDERDAAAKILKMMLQNGFAFSVFSIDRRLRLQHSFTSDRNALAQAINAATEPEKPGSDSAANPTEKELISVALTGVDGSGKKAGARERVLAQALYAALKSYGPLALDQHIRPSLAGLLALIQSQQEIGQRKAIVYFSSIRDKQIDSHARGVIESIIGTANRAGVGIYVVDVNSINGNGSQTVMTSVVVGDTSGYTGPPEGMGMAQRRTETSLENPDVVDMVHLSEQTGGSYISGDRLWKSVEQLIGDMTTYYEASYLPPVKEYDGRFRPVVVKPLRAGLKIRTQAGYLALPPRAEDGSRPQPFELPLSRLLKQTPLPADLNFRAAILTMGEHTDGAVSALAIEVPLTSLDTQKDTNTPTYTAHFSMVANIRDQAGALVEHFSADTPQRVTLSNPEMKSVEAISLQRHFVAPPGQYVLEAAILDLNSGKAGAQRIPFEIPKEAGTPWLSKIVLVRRTDPIRAEEDPPLRQGTNRVTPNLSGALPPGATDVSVFFAAHADTHGAEKAKLEIQVLRDGKPLGGAPMSAQPINGTEYLSYLSSFSIHAPQDGAYQVKVMLSQGGKTAEAETSFIMSGVEAADPDDPPGSAGLGNAARPGGPLTITFPSSPIQPPSPDELKAIIANATRYAMDYRDSLPNFICEQVTERSVSLDGSITWRHKDKVTGMITYFDHAEDWSLLETERDGRKSHIDENTVGEKGISSEGLFGAVITGLFRPLSKAEIAWKETGVLGDGTVQVFGYRVAQENSNLNLRVGPMEVITVGYHGLVYIDSTTHSVRRITEVADDVPKKYPIHAASVSADYDYVSIGGQDYLMPVGAQVILKKGRHETDLNEIGFRDFHRFGSTTKILEQSPDEKP